MYQGLHKWRHVIPIKTIKIDYQMVHCHLKFLCELQCLCLDLFLLLPLISHFLVFLWLTTNPRSFLTNSILAPYLLYSTRFHQIPSPIVFRPSILVFQGLALNLRSFCFSSPSATITDMHYHTTGKKFLKQRLDVS